MATVQQVINGLKLFTNNELIEKLTGVKKWIVGASFNMYLDNGAEIFNSLKTNEFIQALNVINQDDEIDIEKVYRYFVEQAKKSAVTFSLPLVGSVTLKAADIEKIYSLIKES